MYVINMSIPQVVYFQMNAAMNGDSYVIVLRNFSKISDSKVNVNKRRTTISGVCIQNKNGHCKELKQQHSLVITDFD